MSDGSFHTSRGFVLRGLAVALISLSAACTEGYPPADHVPEEPQRMSTAQRIEALNDLTERTPIGRAWRYSMPQECVLRVQRRSGKDSVDLRWRLSTTRFELDRLEGAETFTILARDVALPTATPESVLQTSRWFDARFALSLLSYLQQDCSQSKGK